MLKNVRFAFFRRNTREKERKKSTFEVIIVSFYNWFYVFLKFSPFFLVVVTVCETTLNFFKVEHLLYNSYFTFEMLTVFFLFSLILSFVKVKYPVRFPSIPNNPKKQRLFSSQHFAGDVLMTQWSKECKGEKCENRNLFVDVTKGCFKVIIIVLSPAGCLGNTTITKTE